MYQETFLAESDAMRRLPLMSWTTCIWYCENREGELLVTQHGINGIASNL